MQCIRAATGQLRTFVQIRISPILGLISPKVKHGTSRQQVHWQRLPAIGCTRPSSAARAQRIPAHLLASLYISIVSGVTGDFQLRHPAI